MADKTITINLDFQAKNLTNIQAQLKNLVNQVDKNGLKMGFDQTSINKMKSDIQLVSKTMADNFNKNTGDFNYGNIRKTLETSNVDMQKLNAQAKKFGIDGTDAFSKITKSAYTFTNEVKKSSGWMDKVAFTLNNTFRWRIANAALNQISQGIQKAYYFAKDLDKALTDISIVSEKNHQQMLDFAKEANQGAKELKTSTIEYAKASLIFFQQGMNASDVEKMTKATIIGANIAGNTTEEMSNLLTAVMQGYGYQADEIMNVVDKLSAVGATTAADFEELATGMSKVAAMAKTAGVPIDQLNAQIATIVSTTKESPEIIGNSLKTIYARMLAFRNDSKGILLDEEGDSFSAPSVEAALQKYNKLAGTNISLFETMADGTKKVREMGPVLDEIGDSWGNTTDNIAKFGLATSLAGVRQQNRLIALFNNWDDYKESVVTSLESEGKGISQNAVYLDSYQASVKKLQADTEALYMTLFNGDDLKVLVNGLDILVNGATSFIKIIGGLPTILSVVVGLMAKAGSSKFFTNMATMQSASRTVAATSTIDPKTKTTKEAPIQDKLASEIAQVKRVFPESHIAELQKNLDKIHDINVSLATLETNLERIQVREKGIDSAAHDIRESFSNIQKEQGRVLTEDQIKNNPAKIQDKDIQDLEKYIDALKKPFGKDLPPNLVKSIAKFKKEYIDTGKTVEEVAERFEDLYDEITAVQQRLSKKDTGFSTAEEASKYHAEQKAMIDAEEKRIQLQIESDAEIAESTEKWQRRMSAAITSMGAFASIIQNEDIPATQKLTQGLSVVGGLLVMNSDRFLQLAKSNYIAAGGTRAMALSLKGITTGALAAARAIGVVLLELAPVIALAAAIAGLIWLIDEMNITAEEQTEAFTKASNSYTEAKEKLEGLEDSLKRTKERLDELHAKDKLTIIEQEELEKLEKANLKLEKEIKLQERLAELEKAKLKETITTGDLTNVKTIKTEKWNIEEHKKAIIELENWSKNKLSAQGLEDIQEAIQKHENAILEAESKIMQVSTQRAIVLDMYAEEIVESFEKNGEKIGPAVQQFLNSYVESLSVQDIPIRGQQDLIKQKIEELKNSGIDELIIKYKELQKSIAFGNSSKENVDELARLGYTISMTTEAIADGDPAMRDFIARQNEMYPTTLSTSKALEVQQTTLEGLVNAYIDSSKQFAKLQEIKEKLSKTKTLNLEDLEGLKELGIYAIDAADALEQITNKEVELTETARQQYSERMMFSESFYKNTILGNKTLVSQLAGFYDGDLTNFKTLAELKGVIEAELIKNLAKGWELYYNAASQATTEDYGLLKKAADAGNQAAKDQIAGIVRIQKMQAAMKKLSQIDFSFTLPSEGSTAKEAKEVDLYAEAVRQLNEELKHLDYMKSLVSETSKEYRDILLKEIELQKQLQQLAATQANALRAQGFAETSKEIQALQEDWRQAQEKINTLTFEIDTSSLDEMVKVREGLTDQLELLKIAQEGTIEDSEEYNRLLGEQNILQVQVAASIEKEIAAIRNLIATGNLSGAQIEELNQRMRELVKEAAQIQAEFKRQLIDMATKQIEAMKAEYETQKSEALEAIEDELKAEERRHKEVLKNLDAELEAQNDIIDAKLKMIEALDEERSYNNDLADLQEERQEIQERLNALILDDSEWSLSLQEDLKEELADTDRDIGDLTYDYNKDLRIQNLEDLRDLYKKDVEAKRDAEDEKYELTRDSLEDQKQETERYYSDILDDEEYWAQETEQIVEQTMDEVTRQGEAMAAAVIAKFRAMGVSINKDLIPQIQAAARELAMLEAMGISTGGASSSIFTDIINSGSNYSSAPTTSTVTQGAFAPGLTFDTETMKTKDMSTGKTYTPGELIPGYTFNPTTGHYYPEYHEGGIVGKPTGDKVSNLLNDLLNQKPNEATIRALIGEVMVPPKNFSNLFGNIQGAINTTLSSGLQNQSSPVTVEGGDNYYFNLNIESLTGDRSGANLLMKEINKSLRRAGKK